MYAKLTPVLRCLAAIALACCFSSCSMFLLSEKTSHVDVRKLQKGMREQQVRKDLNIHSTAQFKTFEGKLVEGRSARLGERSLACYFIYEDGALAAVHRYALHPQVEIVREGTKWNKEVREHPRQRLSRVYQQPNLLNDPGAFYQATLNTDIPRQKSYNMLPAFVILAPLMVATEPLMLTAIAVDKGKQSKWNISHVEPGDTISSLTRKFGKPIAIVNDTYYFGPAGSWKENPASVNKRLMVEMREGKVIAAFGDEFYKDP